MIHLGIDHRCVMATFMITMFVKNIHIKDKKKNKTRLSMMNATKQKNISIEMPELEKRCQEIADTKKAAATKGNETHDTRKNAKIRVKRENAAAAEANRTLEEAEVQEIERRIMKCSSTVANQRCVPALIEHRRQDGWTSIPCVIDNIRKDSEYDKTAGERLLEQRPHSIEKIKMKQEHKKSKEEARRAAVWTQDDGEYQFWSSTCVKTIGRFHLALAVVAAAAAATCWQGDDCRNNAHKVMNILNTNLKNILVCKFRIRMKRQVLSCSIPAATRARSRTTIMKREWWHLQQQKWANICRSKMLKSWYSSRRGEYHTQRRETTIEIIEQVHENVSEKREWKDSKTSKEFLKNSKAYEISWESNQQRRKYTSQRQNDKGECITSRKGIAEVFGEFNKRFSDDNEKDDSEHELGHADNYSSTTTILERWQEFQILRQKSCKPQSTNSEKANLQTAKEFEPKTLKHVMRRREKWWDKSSTRL